MPLCQSRLDAQPGLSWGIGNRPWLHLGPAGGSPKMAVRPTHNPFHGQRRHAGLVADLQASGQQLRQGRSAAQAAAAIPQGLVDRLPGFPRMTGNRVRILIRPFAGALEMLLRPAGDFLFGENGQVADVPYLPELGQDPSQWPNYPVSDNHAIGQTAIAEAPEPLVAGSVDVTEAVLASGG